MVDLTNELTRMSRRRFLESLAAIGLTSETVRHITKEDLHGLTGDPTDEVPRVKALRVQNKEKWDKPPFPEKLEPREPEYYKVPYDQHVEIESAYDAAENLLDEIRKVDDSGLITAGVTLTTRGQHEQYAVQVNAITKIPPGLKNKFSKPGKAKNHDLARSPNIELDELRGELPEQATGSVGEGRSNKHKREDIPIEFSEKFEVEEGCGIGDQQCEAKEAGGDRYYDQQYRFASSSRIGIPSGCRIEPYEYWPNYSGNGTLGPRVFKPGEGLRYTSTAHQFFNDCEEGVVGPGCEDPEDGLSRGFHQPERDVDDTVLGRVEDIVYESDQSSNDWDTAIIEPQSDFYPSNQLAAQNSDGAAGRLSSDRIGEDALKDLRFSNRLCYQGSRSGRCEKPLTEVNTIRDPTRFEVHREYDNGGGNSGGPYFFDDDGEKLVVGIHRAGYSTGRWDHVHYGVGYWIGSLEERFNVEVR